MDDDIDDPSDETGAFEELVELQLPPVMPLFPLPNAILIPGCVLPLNIFEPRYLAMVRDAAKSHRMIGMIQPKGDDDLYEIGGGGMINEMKETEDGRLLISLIGICRFKLVSEMSVATPYRQGQIDWHSFESDIDAHETARQNPNQSLLDRPKLFAKLEAYLSERGLGYDADAINKAPDDVLIDNLAMMIPLSSAEKQALLEAATVAERGSLLITMLEMAATSTASDPAGPANLN